MSAPRERADLLDDGGDPAAHAALLTHPRFDERPCAADPTAWDSPRRGTWDAWWADVGRWSARICLTACPVLAECRAWADTGPVVDGVLAGRAPRRYR